MENQLTFQSENIEFELENPALTEQWIQYVINLEKGDLGFINYVFCNDTFLLTLNQEYLNHDTLTDIITFHYSEDQIESDIFISIDRVRENATLQNTTFVDELNRVIIHGALHLLGYADKSAPDKKTMRSKENEMLEIWNSKKYSSE